MSEQKRMDPTVKAKWVAALRSGPYQQGRDALRIGNKYCCLGVLCDINNPGGWMPKFGKTFEMDGCDGLPPKSVASWAGFQLGQHGFYQTPKVLIHGALLPLDSHNDEGRTFSEIADAIEAQL